MAYINGKEILFSAKITGSSGSADTTELEEQIANLTAENTELKAQNTELTTENANLSSHITTLNAEKSALTLQVTNLTNRVSELETENAELTERIEELEGESGSGGDNTGGGSTDQTSTAGAYTDATFTTRAYKWDELLERGDTTKNGGISPYLNPPSVELAGYCYVYGENYAFVIPDTITTGVGTEGCRALVFPATTTKFESSMEGTIGTIYIKATTPPELPWENFFEDCNYNGSSGGYVRIVVLKGCGETYRNWTNWSQYADRIEEGEMPI